MKEALERLVRAARTAKKTDDALRTVGYDNTPYFDIFGDIVDGIYELLEENTGTLDESITYESIIDPNMTNAESAERLESEYSASRLTVSLSPGTMEALAEAAAGFNTSPYAVVKLILSEWLINRERIKSAM